ncbi:MAG TPA: hypothetical protein VD813_01740 [Pseudonocardia sp.]|nr:hypothetical protein [Pseudonocardia sp.]
MDEDRDRLRGVALPMVDGRRSSAALGRAVVADALRAVDPVGARAAEQETDWRRGYLVHVRRLVEAGLDSHEAALTIARDGANALRSRMRFGTADGERPLAEAAALPAGDPPLATATVAGTAEPEPWLRVPHRGGHLHGDGLARKLDEWVEAGVMEPSCATAVRLVADHPEWLRLPGQRVVVLGAGAEMGPLAPLLRWGADVVAVDLPRPALWRGLLTTAREGAGRLHLPVTGAAAGRAPAGAATDLGAHAGVDLLGALPALATWLSALDGPLVLGNYVYADGVENLRVSAAADALTEELRQRRGDVALAFLATPTDVFAVPAETVADANARYARRRARRLLRRPVRVLSGGRLLTRNYPPGADPGICDSLVPQQGPNYALAKRLQRWRAAEARAAGVPVSLTVAPPTRTRSVVRNRVLAAAYAGAHRFGVEVFEPRTSSTLMAALLVHDLCAGPRRHEHPWRDEADRAVHGGLWRQPYAPRSVLGLAVLLGWAGRG